MNSQTIHKLYSRLTPNQKRGPVAQAFVKAAV